MHAQMFFQDQTAKMNFFEAFARWNSGAIISAQIRQRLFAFENGTRPKPFAFRPISRHIRAIATLRQSYFHCACRIAVRLRPEQGQTFEASVCRRFAADSNYSLIHSANSRAQYVTIMSAPARLSDVMISSTAARSSMNPFSTAALIIANSPLT